MGRQSVSVETKSTNYVPFIVTPENPFNKAAIEKMDLSWYETEEDNGTKTKRCALYVLFVNNDGTRHHSHYENEIEGDIGNLTEEKRIKAQDAHLAQLYDIFMGIDAFKTAGPNGSPLGTVYNPAKEGEAPTVMANVPYHKFFQSVLHSFMTGRDGKPVFQNAEGAVLPFWLKLTYDRDGRLQVPLFGNFVQIYEKGKECLLQVDSRYDVVSKPAPKQHNNQYAANEMPAADTEKRPQGFNF